MNPDAPSFKKTRKGRGVVFCRFARSGRQKYLASAHVAQLAEHVLGKDEVISSNLIMGSMTCEHCNGTVTE
jgi:hypothetical protein